MSGWVHRDISSENIGIRSNFRHTFLLREVPSQALTNCFREIKKYFLLILNTEEANHDFSTAITADITSEKMQDDFYGITNNDGIHNPLA